MKKRLFYAVLLLCISLSILGIYSLEKKVILFPFVNKKMLALCMTIVFLQLLYLFGKKDNSKAYANVPKNEKNKEKESIKSSVKLDDVAGLEEVKEEIMEIADFINHAEKYKKMGAKIPKGILLYGPPGTGKTLLASALAGETNTEFIVASGSEFMEKYVGVGAKRVRELFEKAKEKAPCIIFIDEIDAIGAKRSEEGQSECNQTLNQLLTEMDGFKLEDESIIVIIGATNRIDILDAALLRPGRFDKHVYIGNPNKIARKQMLKVHTKNKPLSKEVSLEKIAIKTHGLSGAHISSIVNEAALLAVRNNREQITPLDFDNAIERIIAGLKMKNSTISEKEKRIVSFHEAGHALVGKLLKVHSIEKISIIPTSQALGYVLNASSEDQYLYTKKDLLKRVQSILAGRAAEEIIFGEVTTGAKDDLNKATDIILGMICEYGMSDLGNRTFNTKMIYGNMEKINDEVKKIIDSCYENTLNLLKENKTYLTSIAEQLFEKESLSGDELNSLMETA
ncbi:ATP-dependent metallopeptidase FtsH/Yme1/Tma family protein [Crassaminicella profunda]|uniref:ATP-dependent metallopeptidase FtsH/Yme1/Tma family protein n=1 Tax=Crassaminicella profunda TaxID=1286698 RepID=UPI001CA75A0A|nr:AAA family ATPase [Crassaminicella profunda]QZY54030.1 AAA family ATPase [Crassaminicella profunda]